MKHNIVLWGPQASGIDGEHVPVFSADVVGDSLSWSFDECLKWKDANVCCFITILNLQSADVFSEG